MARNEYLAYALHAIYTHLFHRSGHRSLLDLRIPTDEWTYTAAQ
jgi:hypothetical protein